MAAPVLPVVQPNASLEELRDQVAILQKTITYYLSSNLGTSNIAEIGGWILNDTDIVAQNGTVGMSSLVSPANDIRFWAGDTNSGNAPFQVYEDGSLIASKATITGNINMTGGSIIWGNIPAPDYSLITGNKPPADANNTYNELLFNSGIRGFVSVGGTLFLSADYIRTGFIRSDLIQAGSIQAYQIDTTNLSATRIYQPGSPDSWVEVGGKYGDLILRYNNQEYFKVYNDLGGSAGLYSYGTRFLTSRGSSTYPLGTWDFSGSTTNLVAKFA